MRRTNYTTFKIEDSPAADFLRADSTMKKNFIFDRHEKNKLAAPAIVRCVLDKKNAVDVSHDPEYKSSKNFYGRRISTSESDSIYLFLSTLKIDTLKAMIWTQLYRMDMHLL